MKIGWRLVFSAVTLAFSGLILQAAAVRTTLTDKIDLRVFYAGHPDSERESDYVAFLEKHFAKVGRGDLAKFNGSQADGFDVVILDHDAEPFKAPKAPIG